MFAEQMLLLQMLYLPLEMKEQSKGTPASSLPFIREMGHVSYFCRKKPGSCPWPTAKEAKKMHFDALYFLTFSFWWQKDER